MSPTARMEPVSHVATKWSVCANCPEWIKTGQRYVWTEFDEPMHLDCSAVEPAEEQVPEVCPECHMAKAANGTCGCDS